MRLIGSLCIYFGRLGGWAGRPRDGRAGGGQRGGPGATEAIARRFFDFLRDVPRGIIGFEAISDQGEGRPEGVILVSGLGRGAAGARPEPRKIRFRTIPVAISDHGQFLVSLLGRGTFYKVGVSCTREATFGADIIVWGRFGKPFSEQRGRK